jgi:squalene synthase HpnC
VPALATPAPSAPLDPRTPPIDLLPVVGPDAPPRTFTPAEALAYCHGLATSHYENFSVLTSLVPPRLRDDFAAVYAFCRWADDLGDETGNTAEARARSESLLAWWRDELRRCFAPGEDPRDAHPAHPVFVALRATAARHPHLTPRPFEDLIDAFVQDQRLTRYETWDQLLDYCSRSANPVGRIVLTLGGYAPPGIDPANAECYAQSDATCTALQLINFWQDVRRDLRERDRVYIPEHGPDGPTGISHDLLADWIDRPDDPRARVPFIKGLRPLVDHTEALFDRGRPLPSTLDDGLAPVVWLFGAGGDAILRAVRRIGCATLWERPRLGKVEKALLVGRAWLRSRRSGRRPPG